MGQQVCGVVANADFQRVAIGSDDHTVQRQWTGKPLVLLDAAVVVGSSLPYRRPRTEDSTSDQCGVSRYGFRQC